MMTSYFGRVKSLKGQKLVSIARYSPRYYSGEKAIELAPPAYIIHEENEERYKEVFYREVLSKLNAEEIYRKYGDCILLCYEKPGEFCHRRLVAEWIEKKLGKRVDEVEFKTRAKKEECEILF